MGTATENSLNVLGVLEDALLGVGAEAGSAGDSCQDADIGGHFVLSFGFCGLDDAGQLIKVNFEV